MKYGIIISVEKYENSENFPMVKYANKDAGLIKEIFLNILKIPEDNLFYYENEGFTKTVLENEIGYLVQGIEPEAELFFYYAGHGFYSEGTNYLTGYDTNIIDLHATSISFDELLLNYIKKSNVKRSIFFIDACSEFQPQNSRSIDCRGLLFADDKINSLNCSFSYAIYISCSPKEKSYSSNKLEHGIWTWYLARAFQGDMKAWIVLSSTLGAPDHSYISQIK